MLARLIARDFRNLAPTDLAVPDRGLAIVGDNGQGKTNLLEAVSYLGLLRSLRGARDADVVRFGATAFHVRAELRAPSPLLSVAVGFERASKRKRAALDGVEQPRLAAALGALPSVCFSPADVALVAGGPGERRRWLDVALAMSSRAYLAALQQYRAALQRRNAALREAQRQAGRAGRAPGQRHADEERVAVWEPALAAHGGALAAARHAFVRRHAEAFSALAAAIGERAVVTMRYVGAGAAGAAADAAGDAADAASDPAAQAARYAAAFAAQRAQELRRGVTLVGPHRDELQLLMGGRELRTFGSAGQQRSAAIGLRLLELGALREAIGATPLLLLDDPFAELDLGRAARVLGLLEAAGIGQVLLAVPRLEDIPEAFTRLERRGMQGGVVGDAVVAA
jgi:DNA replication and repair protein RecF